MQLIYTDSTSKTEQFFPKLPLLDYFPDMFQARQNEDPSECESRYNQKEGSLPKDIKWTTTCLVIALLIVSPTLMGSHIKQNHKEIVSYQIDNPNAALHQFPLEKAAEKIITKPSIEIPQPQHLAEEPERKKEDNDDPPFYQLILQAADLHDMDPALIRAVIMAESSYNPNAVSKSGARGLMQLMPRTAKALGVQDIMNPEHNINGGVKYLRQMLDRFNGDMTLALAAYNAGSRYVLKYKGIPPFKETQNYIEKVMTYYETYRKEMTDEDELV